MNKYYCILISLFFIPLLLSGCRNPSEKGSFGIDMHRFIGQPKEAMLNTLQQEGVSYDETRSRPDEGTGIYCFWDTLSGFKCYISPIFNQDGVCQGYHTVSYESQRLKKQDLSDLQTILDALIDRYGEPDWEDPGMNLYGKTRESLLDGTIFSDPFDTGYTFVWNTFSKGQMPATHLVWSLFFQDDPEKLFHFELTETTVQS